MIKGFTVNKIDEVMKIWLETNLTAHNFIPETYWVNNYHIVKEQYMPIAKTFVYEEDGATKGFISIIGGSFVGALFVEEGCQGQGIGMELINHCKALYPNLELAVYVENVGAVNFYKRCGFRIQDEQVNKDSGFREYIMCWTK